MLTNFVTVQDSSIVAEWERHEPGHFSVALFDHRKRISFL